MDHKVRLTHLRSPRIAAAACVISLAGSAINVANATAQTPPAASEAPRQTPEARGQAIADAIARRAGGYRDMSARLELVIGNDGREEARRALRLRLLERPEADRGDLSLLIFDSPADVAGTALLSHAGVLQSDEQWLYLPATRRVRRIAASNASGAFLGSEFTYEDITGGEVGKHTWRVIGEGVCETEGLPADAQCTKVETRPRSSSSGYARRVVFIGKTDQRVHKIDFYDRQDRLLKTLTYSDYQTHGNFLRAHRWSMKNHQTRRTTVITLSEVRFGNGFSAGDFTPAALERAR